MALQETDDGDDECDVRPSGYVLVSSIRKPHASCNSTSAVERTSLNL